MEAGVVVSLREGVEGETGLEVDNAGEQEIRMNVETRKMEMSLRIWVHFHGNMAA
jgi:hypothetical protein